MFVSKLAQFPPPPPTHTHTQIYTLYDPEIKTFCIGKELASRTKDRKTINVNDEKVMIYPVRGNLCIGKEVSSSLDLPRKDYTM